MVHAEEVTIYNSTFDELIKSTNNSQSLWKTTSYYSSLSTIEHYFNPNEIKKIVDSLVLSRFGTQYRQKFMKSMSRRSRFLRSDTDSSVSFSDLELTPRSSEYNLASNYSSNAGSETEEEVMNYFDTCLGFTNMTPESNSKETTQVDSWTIGCVDSKIQNLRCNKTQIYKAIECHKSKNIRELSKARLEAEKLLLITNIQIGLLLQRGSSFDSFEKNNLFFSATISISRIHIWPEDNHFSEGYFVCTILHQCQVYATEISKIKSNGVLCFNKRICLPLIQHDSKLSVRVYSISEKIFKNKHSEIFCYKEKRNQFSESPGFVFCGEINLFASDFSKSRRLKRKCLFGSLIFNFTTAANINFCSSGFFDLSLMKTKYPVWNRQWCSLRGRCLRFYNYPSQEEFSVTPNFEVELSSSSHVKVLTREECSRNRTMILKIDERNKVLLSCESQEAFDKWKECLQSIVDCLKTWDNE